MAARPTAGGVRRRDATDVVVDGLAYAEGLRWHRDRLWLSDMLRDVVLAVDEDRRVEQVFDAGEPSGLGFVDDDVIVVCRTDATLRRGRPGDPLAVLADLGGGGVVGVNDLLVDEGGRCYVGSLGKRYELGDEDRAWGADAPGRLLLVEPDGTWRPVADGLGCPNGMVLTPDGGTLVVAQTYGRCLTAFSRSDDGSLHERRDVARFTQGRPDGLALDHEGAYWVALGDRCARVDADGIVTEEVRAPGFRVIACALGGADRSTLFLAVCQMEMAGFLERRSVGQLRAIEVDVPGAGLP
jgi:sugar lactone lactonase YvrE